jgi:hypothetical protein
MAVRLKPTMMKSKIDVLVAEAAILHDAISTSVAESLISILGNSEIIPEF